MRCKHFMLALVAVAALALLPSSARADNVTFNFTPPSYTGAAGSVVTLFGTITNGAGPITFTGYQDSLQTGLTVFGAVQPFDALVGLSSGQTTGPIALFNVMIAAGTPNGTVFTFAFNQFEIFYLDSLGNEIPVGANFQITVVNGGGGGAVPEPTTMLLLGTGLAGAALAKRRKRRQGLET